jgi:hypothetical protein
VENDKAARALLQYRNTPIKDIGLSPAQILFHRNLRDSIPVDPQYLRPHKSWLMAATNREKLMEERNAALSKRYNTFSKTLPVISIGSNVIIQDPNTRRWNRHGIVVEMEGRKYTIRINGSNRIVTRNRKFLKVDNQDHQEDHCDIFPLTQDQSNVQEMPESGNEETHVEDSNIEDDNIAHSSVPVNESAAEATCHVPLMLRRLQPFNNPGLKE